MAQADLVISANPSGIAMRQEVNSSLEALATLASGATAPATMYPYMFWVDTANALLKQRNATNDAWITLGTLGVTNWGLVPKVLFDAYSILAADVDDTPATLTVGASTIVGRKAAGGIVALTAAEARTILNVANGAAPNVKLAGDVVQVVNVQTGAVITGNTGMPFDDSIPQKSEGNEYMQLAITPTSASNKLKIQVVWNGARDNGGELVLGLFKDLDNDALAAITQYATQNQIQNMTLVHYMTAPGVSAYTFKALVGWANNPTPVVTFNGVSGGRKLGGVMSSSITITEIKV